jgi:hypothetical protein
LSIPLGKLGYLAPRIHRVLSESLSESLSTDRYTEARRRLSVLARFTKRPDDVEANLAARVRLGKAPITRTGQGTVPSKIKQPEQETEAPQAATASSSAEAGSSGTHMDVQADATGSETWTSVRREIQFSDEEPKGSGACTPTRGPRREIQFFDEVPSGSPEATVAK